VTTAATARTDSSELAAHLLGVAAIEGVSVLFVSQSSSTNAVCVVTSGADAGRLRIALLRRPADGRPLAAAPHVAVDAPVALVSVEDDDLAESSGVALFLGALANAGVNIIAIALRARDRRITCCVREADREAAERAVREVLAHDADVTTWDPLLTR
jgi:aspartokinase/homoserine dehydrogenase 1